MQQTPKAASFWPATEQRPRGTLAGPLAQLRRYARVVAHRHFDLTMRPYSGCSTGKGPGEIKCFGGNWVVELVAGTTAPSAGWLHVELMARCEAPGLGELALEATGAQLPPHSQHAPLVEQKKRGHYTAHYFLAPGTERLFVYGRSPAGTSFTLHKIAGYEQGSHEVRLRSRAQAMLGTVTNVHKLERDVVTLTQAVRRRDWKKILRAARGRAIEGAHRDDYAAWIRRHDTLTSSDVAQMHKRMAAFTDPPHFSIIVPCYNTPAKLLAECIDSVERQIYPNWQLCLSNDASTEPQVARILDAAAARDPRITVVHCRKNGHIARASNAAIEVAKHPWLALLDHDDVLSPHALYLVAAAIDAQPDAGIVYSDEDKLDPSGHRCQPYFKPAYNPDLLLSQNYVSHFGVYRKALVDAVGGFRPAFNGSQDYDLLLRVVEQLAPHQIVHVPHVLYHWRQTPGSAALSIASKPYAYTAGEMAIAEHLSRTGRKAQVRPSIYAGQYHVKYALPQKAPKVSIVVPSRDNVAVLDRCVETLRALTSYPNYELVVVDNDSLEETTQRYVKQLAGKPNVRCLAYNYPFNYAAINNWAVQQCDGDVICLLNDDVEILHADWLEEMVGQAMRPEVGAVGAKLLYPNRTLQHGGVTLGVGHLAAHAFRGVDENEPAYFGRAALVHNVTAVTAACLVIRRSTYLEMGGLDERLAVAYNDLDFCLRLYEAGYNNLWTPHARLVHHESASRGRDNLTESRGFRGEWAWTLRRWKAYVEADPNYNPNLTTLHEGYTMADKPRHPHRLALRPQLPRSRRQGTGAAVTAAKSGDTEADGKTRRARKDGGRQLPQPETRPEDEAAAAGLRAARGRSAEAMREAMRAATKASLGH